LGCTNSNQQVQPDKIQLTTAWVARIPSPVEPGYFIFFEWFPR